MARGLFKLTSTTVVQTVNVLLHKKINSLVASRKYQLFDVQSSAMAVAAKSIQTTKSIYPLHRIQIVDRKYTKDHSPSNTFFKNWLEVN